MKKEIVFPKECPVCSGPVEMQGENLICLSTDVCPAQTKGRILNWINSIGVLEWGSELVDKLIENKVVSNVSDLYQLTVDDLSKLERMGEKSARKCYNSLWSKKDIALEKFLGSLSIPMAATSTIKMVIEAGHDNLDKIMKLSIDDMVKIKGIGSAKAAFLKEGLRRNEKIISNLLSSGVSIKDRADGNLTGTKICITGSTNLKRSELQNMITENGGTYKPSVSKGVTHLVISDPESNSIKAQTARGLGVKLITEQELLRMINEN